MADVQMQQGGAAGSSNPLLDLGILQNVLSYVGPGHHLFIALVSRCWKNVHIALGSEQVSVYFETSGSSGVSTASLCAEMTFYSSAFASPSRAKLACE
eukprot:2507-Heterococcus_DN1.PRE.1